MQHSKATVGSMTMAMKAVRAEEHGPKVMRLGVLEGSRISEERIVRDLDNGATITVGRDPSCTIALSSEGAPEKLALFTRVDGRWVLEVVPGVEGRVLLDSKVISLSEMSAHSKLSLDETARGKVTLCGVSVLFQFVIAPPLAPKPQLPSSIMHKPLRELDWRYNACVAGFMAMAFTGLGYVEYGYDPEIEAMDIREEVRLVRIDAAPATPEPTAPGADAPEPNPSDSNAPAPRTPSTRNQNTAQNSAQNTAANRERQIANAARSADHAGQAALAELNNSMQYRELANATGGVRSAAAMIRNGQGLMDNSVAQLSNVGGITAGTDRPGIQRTGMTAQNGPGTSTLGGPRRVDGPGEIATNTVVPVERVIRARVTTSGPTVDDPAPGLPMPEIARVFRNNLGAIQSCYTAALRNNGGLRGRLEVEFTIGTTGRIVGAVRASGISGGDEVHQCVERRVRSYVFPQVSEASEVMFPVSLEPGG